MLKVTIYSIDAPCQYEPGMPVDCVTVECQRPLMFRSFETDVDAMAYAESMREETGHNVARYITRD